MVPQLTEASFIFILLQKSISPLLSDRSSPLHSNLVPPATQLGPRIIFVNTKIPWLVQSPDMFVILEKYFIIYVEFKDMNLSETLTTCVGTGTLTQPVHWQSEKRKSWISQTDTEDIWRSFEFETNKTFARGLLTHEISHYFKVPTWRY